MAAEDPPHHLQSPVPSLASSGLCIFSSSDLGVRAGAGTCAPLESCCVVLTCHIDSARADSPAVAEPAPARPGHHHRYTNKVGCAPGPATVALHHPLPTSDLGWSRQLVTSWSWAGQLAATWSRVCCHAVTCHVAQCPGSHVTRQCRVSPHRTGPARTLGTLHNNSQHCL